MKKVMVLSLLIMALAGTAVAQERQAWDVYVGPKVGATLTNLTNTDGSAKFGFMAGGFFEVMIDKNWSLGMDLYYNMAGANDGKYNGKYIKSCDYNLGYVSTDYLFKYYFNQLVVSAGVHAGFLTNAKAKADYDKLSLPDDVKVDGDLSLTDNLKKTDVTFPIGVGYEVGKLMIEAKYFMPLSNIAKKETQEHMLKDAKNSMFMITVGYKFQTM